MGPSPNFVKNCSFRKLQLHFNAADALRIDLAHELKIELCDVAVDGDCIGDPVLESEGTGLIPGREVPLDIQLVRARPQ